MRVYVAGKYSDSNIIGCLNNIHEGIKMSVEVLKLGHACFCPWLDYQFQFFCKDLVVEHYYRYSMAWLEVSECVLVLPNYETSKGTLAEIKRAKELNIPIYYKLEDLPKGLNVNP
jgi:hypothetical protein